MSCNFAEDLTAFVDGELEPARREALAAHLPTCAGCQATVGALQGALAQVAKAARFEPSPSLRYKTMARISEQSEKRWRRWMWAPSLAAAAVALLAIFSLGRDGRLPPDAASLELAQNLEVVENFELLGLDSAEDLETAFSLRELEATP
jgi:anti-sigma factor RsiW